MDADDAAEDEDSFAVWYRAEYRGLLRTLVLAIGNTDVATEATTEAFARALQRWNRVSLMASPTGWTYTMALNVARRMLRRARFEAHVQHRHSIAPPVHTDAMEVWGAVQRLPRHASALLSRCTT